MRRALMFSFVLWSAGAAAQIPVLQVAPVNIAFVADGRGPVTPQQVRIRNIGSGTLRWTARPDAPWIRVSPASGSGAASLNVGIDIARLTPGRHEGRITVDAPEADDAPVDVVVVVEIIRETVPAPAAGGAVEPGAPPRSPVPSAKDPTGAGGPVPSAPTLTGAGQPGPGAAASRQLRIERQTLPPATRNLPYSQAIPILGGTPPYSVRIVEGRLPAGLVLAQGSISGTARVQGYYPFVVAVTDAATPPVTIAHPLGLRVIILQPDTALVVGPPAISLRLAGRTRDGRAALTIASGRQRLEWTASADVAWIRLAPTAGLSPATLEIIALAGQLTPGTHLGTVTVIMEGAPNSPASIPVQVTVPR
jgi:hypothetical protein